MHWERRQKGAGPSGLNLSPVVLPEGDDAGGWWGAVG